MIRAVLFDLDDTLYDYGTVNRLATEELCAFTCGKLAVREDAFYEAYDRARAETKRGLGNTGASHNRLLYCQKTLEYLGQPPAELALDMYEVYWGYMLEHMTLRDGALELLKRCRARGLKVGVCTDLTAHIQHRKLRKLGLSGLVDALVTSEEAGVEKPGEAIYRLILQKMDLRPEQALFIGDSLERDVEGAERIGMQAIWFHDGTDGVHRTARSMEEIGGMIDAIQ